LPSHLSVPSKEIKGPKVGSPEQALIGFLKSNQLEQKDVFEKTIDKGSFYFVKTKQQKIDLQQLFSTTVPEILQSLNWKKSMRWADHNLSWGRPLKSILCLLDKHTINFNFHHLSSCNKICVGAIYDEKNITIKSAEQYFQVLKDKNVVLDQDVREKMILSSLTSIFKKSKCEDNPNLRLVEEVTNLVDHPTALKGSFSADFLVLPEELLNLTMMQHQRYFPMKSLETGKITNSFITISNNQDEKN